MSSDINLKARALFAYSAQAGNQISLSAGEVLAVLSKGTPGGWTKGSNSSGLF